MLSLKNASLNLKANKNKAIFFKTGAAGKKLRLFVYFLLGPLLSFAQGPEAGYYNRIDNKIFLFSKAPGMNLDSVVGFVNRGFSSDKDRIRAYYTWIALNITYDKSLLDSYQLNAGLGLRHLSSAITQHPDTVLKYRKAVCEGFSLLMNKCCERSGIVSRMVIGPTRIDDGEVSDGMLHAWNAVRADSAWYLLDVTWANGYVNQMNRYVKKFSDKYFFFQSS